MYPLDYIYLYMFLICERKTALCVLRPNHSVDETCIYIYLPSTEGAPPHEPLGKGEEGREG